MSRQIEAGEVVTTGFCPFNCSYCYIPKTEMMKEIHEEIREWIRSGKFIDALEAQYGDRLKYVGPDCALSGWSPPTVAFELLNRVHSVIEEVKKKS